MTTKKMFPVRIEIESTGNFHIEWEPEKPQSDICCIRDEEELLKSLDEVGVNTEYESIYCKMPGVPAHDRTICTVIGNSKILTSICQGVHGLCSRFKGESAND